MIALTEADVGTKAVIRQLPDHPGDVPRTYADISKANRLLCYNPLTGIRKGVANYAGWRRRELRRAG